MTWFDGEIRVDVVYEDKLAFKRLARSKGKSMSELIREFIYSQMGTQPTETPTRTNPKKNPRNFKKEYHIRVPGVLNNYLEYDFHVRNIRYSDSILEALRQYYARRPIKGLDLLPSEPYT